MMLLLIICVCFTCLIILLGLAFLICFIGTRTESVPYVMIAMLVGFFLGYIVLDFTFSMLTETYNLSPFFWEWRLE